MNAVVPRRRLSVKTPLINTYDKQMRLCEKKVKKISLAYPANNGNFVASHDASQDKVISISPLYQALASRKSQRKSLELCHKRKSKFHSRSQVLTPDIRRFQATLPQRGASSLSQSSQHKMENDVTQGHMMAYYGKSYEYHRKSKDTIMDDQRRNHLNSFVSPSRPDDMNTSISHPHEYFIRALTTLAINNLTLNNTTSQERRASHNFYDRNIKALLESPTWHENGNPQQLFVSSVGLKNHNLSLENTSTSSSQGDEESYLEPDNRERINRLRNYLKFSGLGEPIMVKVFNEESEESLKHVHRLVRRVHKGLSPEKRERLRLKAHLEYEMSLMKGESFCEEQDQIWMRTASADMGDRDQQLLEEELKHQIMQANQLDDHVDPVPSKHLANGKHRQGQKRINGRAGPLDTNNNIDIRTVDVAFGDNEEDDYPWFLKVRDEEGTKVSQDNMSGTWKSPFTRREMRRRVFYWVKEVENAMGLEWKEKMRSTYGRDLKHDNSLAGDNEVINNVADAHTSS